ncbi:MAG: hypothetical protein EAZ61_07665 [Oscillatoriales cyanobacterium]|jgi:hypothetical protein|nr:MAG: hypothetical protein EAZ61_07665 [Oscillatoriales cyanobacterium]
MSTTSDKGKLGFFQSLLATPTLILIAVGWGVIALLFFLLFSVTLPGEGRPAWYGVGTVILEQMGFLLAGILCLRNGFSNKIVSGRNVWLGIGIGLLSYFVGNLFFSWWELYWGLSPTVSPGDLLYIISYLCLATGMILAVRSRRLNLEVWQWGIVVGIAATGIAIAAWLSYPFEFGMEAPDAIEASPAIEQVVGSEAIADGTVAAPELEAEVEAEETRHPVPAWVKAMDRRLEPFGSALNLTYVVLDVLLLIIASVLLLAFWGGRFSQSWRMIAAAAFSLYIADMWFKYADKNIPDYESGDLLEVFFTFTGVFFAIGAILEYDVSTRAIKSSSRGGRRRRGGASS